jgi:5-methylcytosine-specific restriction endonuclease McrA
MSSASLINGVNGQLTDWSQVNWKQARKIVRNLRQRIFRARKLGQFKQLRRLQKLLIKSHANLLLSVRQITQVNDGSGDSLFNGEPIETHHILPVAEGGTDDSENLKHLHSSCHKQVHSKTKLTGLK